MEDADEEGRGRAFGDAFLTLLAPLVRPVTVRAEGRNTQRTTKLPSENPAIWPTPSPPYLAPLVRRRGPGPNLPHLVTEETLGTRGGSWSRSAANKPYSAPSGGARYFTSAATPASSSTPCVARAPTWPVA